MMAYSNKYQNNSIINTYIYVCYTDNYVRNSGIH